MIKVFFVCIFLIQATILSAQELEVRVTLDSKHVENATIYINGRIYSGTSSDRFCKISSRNITKGDTISASYLTQKSDNLIFDGDFTKSYTLNIKAFTIDEVTINSNKTNTIKQYIKNTKESRNAWYNVQYSFNARIKLVNYKTNEDSLYNGNINFKLLYNTLLRRSEMKFDTLDNMYLNRNVKTNTIKSKYILEYAPLAYGSISEIIHPFSNNKRIKQLVEDRDVLIQYKGQINNFHLYKFTVRSKKFNPYVKGLIIDVYVDVRDKHIKQIEYTTEGESLNYTACIKFGNVANKSGLRNIEEFKAIFSSYDGYVEVTANDVKYSLLNN